jgi:hypothetical protein
MKWVIATIIFLAVSGAEAEVTKTPHDLALGETSVRVNVYERDGAAVTFFAPHHNEQAGLTLAKEFVASRGGRLVEIESFDALGKPARYLKFHYGGHDYQVDPNRIYTENGRACALSPEIAPVVRLFADELLKLILAEDGTSLRLGEQYLVAVHNNTDVDTKAEQARTGDLTAAAFVRGKNMHAEFYEQAEGVYLSNMEEDADNFVFLSGTQLVGYFAERGFNAVVQKSAARLNSKMCSIDDGSLSVYSAQTRVPYICLEADGVTGSYRQRAMFDAVYKLLGNEAIARK